MTPDDHAAIRARAEAATEGPWAAWLDQDGQPHMQGRLMVGNADAVIPDGESWVEDVDVNPVAECLTPEDREFIAHARTDVPALLAEVDRLTRGWGKAVRTAEDLADEVTSREYERDATKAEAERLREEAESYRTAICFETTCTNCARLLDRMIGLEAERDALAAKIERVRSAIRLIEPDHITPQGVRILNAALADPSGRTTPV